MKIVRTQFDTAQQAGSASPAERNAPVVKPTRGKVLAGREVDSLGLAGKPSASGGRTRSARASSGPGETATPVWTKYYYYSSDGDVFEDEGTVERIVTERPNSNRYTAIRFGYAKNGRTVTHVLGEEWGGGLPYEVTFARQFRYDGARQRYLNREFEPGSVSVVKDDTWSDYDGNSIYADWTFDSQVVDLRSYERGLAITDQLAGGGPENTTYLHTSALGSTMASSSSTGSGTFDAAYSAFGQQVMGQTQRYGFAGEWGYQSHEDFDYMHLGARYYNPTTGRFLQRDPIGIAGGLNVYEYVRNGPTVRVDAEGLCPGGSDQCPVCIAEGCYSKGGDPSQSQQDMRNERRNEKIFQIAVEGAAGLLVLVCPLPVAIGLAAGVIISETIDRINGANDESKGVGG